MLYQLECTYSITKGHQLPVFRNHTVFEITRDIKAFLSSEIGITRGEGPKPGSSLASAKSQKLADTQGRLAQAHRQLRNKNREIMQLHSRLGGEADENAKATGILEQNIVWMFCSERTGSTWLGSMMGDLQGHATWNEPLVGLLFGRFHNAMAEHAEKRSEHFILGNRHKKSWLASIKAFVLSEANTRFPQVGRTGCLVVKEPNGSIGAPLLVEAMPGSRVIFLIRDPRDVAASSLEAHQKGGWLYEWAGEDQRKRWNAIPDENPDEFVKTRASYYMQNIRKAKQAYEAHKGPKVLVKYEDLRINTLATMKRIYSTLEINVDKEELIRVVEKHSWENIPAEQKGAGKFNRKAAPGSWREDLTPGQVGIVEQTTAPILKEFYPD